MCPLPLQCKLLRVEDFDLFQFSVVGLLAHVGLSQICVENMSEERAPNHLDVGTNEYGTCGQRAVKGAPQSGTL